MWTRRFVVPLLVIAVATQFLGAAPAHAAAAANRVLIVGDSITQGSAGDFTWRYRLWKHLQADAPGAVDFVGDRTTLYDNIANVQGSTAYADPGFDQDHHALWGQQLAIEKDSIGSAVASSSPSVMLLLMGINDLAWGGTPATAFAAMETLLRNARAQAPGLRVVVGHVLTRWDLLGKVETNVTDTAALNALIDTLPSMPEFSYVRVAQTNGGWNPQADTWDGTHPNSTGEVVIAAGFADALAGMGIGGAYGARTAVQWPGHTVITTAASTATIPGAAPGTLGAVAGDRQATLGWSPASGASGYLINQLQVGVGTTQLAWPVTGTSFTPGVLAGDSLYQFQIVPVNDNGQIRLVWNAAPGANAYAIRSRDLTTGSGWTELPLPVQATTYDLAGIPDHVYDFEIQPGKGVMTGVWSPEASQLIRRTGAPSGWSSQVLVKAYVGRRRVATDFARQWADEGSIPAWKARYGWAGDDCTHFVSEALLAAGLPETGIPPLDANLLMQYQAVNDDGAWWRLEQDGPVRAGRTDGGFLTRNASATFTLGPNFRRQFMLRGNYGQVHEVSDPRLLDFGDVIFFKWAGDSEFTHTVVVTGFDAAGMPLISEHSNEAVDLSLSSILATNPGVTTSYWHLDVLN